MAKKIILPLKSNGYNWTYASIGGVTRVTINNGEDIAHLDELDQKLWTVLSCPVTGLEFDEETLNLMDEDLDGKIRVNEVVSASKWLTNSLRNSDKLLEGVDHIDLCELNTDNEEGKALESSAKRILARIGKEKESIDLNDIAEAKELFEAKVKAKDNATSTTIDNRPYGDNTDGAIEAVNALRDKVADFFMRCKLIAFDEDCHDAVDVSVEKIQSISEKNLATCNDEIANYPLARPNKEGLLWLNKGINPVWQKTFNSIIAMALKADYPDADKITEEEWNAVSKKLDDYVIGLETERAVKVESFDKETSEEGADIKLLNKFLHFYRDFYKLLKNYVVFADFYTRDKEKLATFQCGQLYIDQRCCDLCIKVNDMPKQMESSSLSGMYLIYCHCTSKVKKAEMNIVAALTDGDTDGLRVGKNAIFYDRNGQDWDAIVTNIVDNPISIRQAFWAPYKKLGNWVTEKINKSAAEKEKASMENMVSKTDNAMTTAETTIAKAVEDPKAVKQQNQEPKEKKTPFDIAKFAGIFAAIGMAIGFISSALVSLGQGITAKWYNLPLMIIGVIVVVSGPSMFIAWSKLRKRNLGPVLNANGWAINAEVRINTSFGATLTSLAKYPLVKLPDPYADKKTPFWKKVLYTFLIIVGIFCALFFTNTLKYVGLPFKKEAVEQVEEPQQVTENAEETSVK